MNDPIATLRELIFIDPAKPGTVSFPHPDSPAAAQIIEAINALPAEPVAPSGRVENCRDCDDAGGVCSIHRLPAPVPAAPALPNEDYWRGWNVGFAVGNGDERVPDPHPDTARPLTAAGERMIAFLDKAEQSLHPHPEYVIACWACAMIRDIELEAAGLTLPAEPEAPIDIEDRRCDGLPHARCGRDMAHPEHYLPVPEAAPGLRVAALRLVALCVPGSSRYVLRPEDVDPLRAALAATPPVPEAAPKHFHTLDCVGTDCQP